MMTEFNEEIKLLVKLKHPCPYTEVDAFIDSLPEEIIDETYKDRDREDWTIDRKRYTMKMYFALNSNKGVTKIDVFVRELCEYYANQL